MDPADRVDYGDCTLDISTVLILDRLLTFRNSTDNMSINYSGIEDFRPQLMFILLLTNNVDINENIKDAVNSFVVGIYDKRQGNQVGRQGNEVVFGGRPNVVPNISLEPAL